MNILHTVMNWHSNKNKGLKKTLLFIVSFIVAYRFYLFEAHLLNHFYQASINQLPLTVQNETHHLSVSAGVWCEGCDYRNHLRLRPVRKLHYLTRVLSLKLDKIVRKL